MAPVASDKSGKSIQKTTQNEGLDARSSRNPFSPCRPVLYHVFLGTCPRMFQIAKYLSVSDLLVLGQYLLLSREADCCMVISISLSMMASTPLSKATTRGSSTTVDFLKIVGWWCPKGSEQYGIWVRKWKGVSVLSLSGFWSRILTHFFSLQRCHKIFSVFAAK